MVGFLQVPVSTTPARVILDDGVLGGQPVVSGTRIPAATIAAYLRDGYTPAQICEDYPSLPPDGIEVVERWAAAEYGPNWKRAGSAKLR